MCLKKVIEWLVLLTLENYAESFKEAGYVKIIHCQQIINSDLIMLGVDDPRHRKLLLAGVQLLNACPEFFKCTDSCEMHYKDFT